MAAAKPYTGYFLRPLPDALAPLAELAMDVRWNWNHSADSLWESVDPELWQATGNAWLILQSVSERRLETLAADPDFLAELDRINSSREDYVGEPSWFDTFHGGGAPGTFAYFSMEFGLGEALPIYSGGLGILAGDHVKTASDLGVPLVGVGLLYQRGYFRQALDANGEQLAFYPFNDPTLLPAVPLRDQDGEWLRVELEFPGRRVYLRCWQVRVGRVLLFLLDSNHPLNLPRDRGITGELYGGDTETRLAQEIVLGIGGWRLLERLRLDVTVCHLNEGHAAFVTLERARTAMAREGLTFDAALRATAAGNVFTTHTPVPAAFDRFPQELIAQYFEDYARKLGVDLDALLALGRTDGGNRHELFNMAYLALRGAVRVNAVSRLHGEVSREIFAPLFPRRPPREVPIRHITNGVHMPSWDSAAADALWTRTCGKSRWLGTLESLEREFRKVDDETLWQFCCDERQALVQSLRERLGRQQSARGGRRAEREETAHALDPNALTIGFARRFAEYKRPTLLLSRPDRLSRLLGDPKRPVQIVVAGKAHPRDAVGCALVRQWARFMQREDVKGKVVFIEDYDIGLATELVQGIDLWLNTPRRPWEASGTSGMKVLVNGGLNLSSLDGWWNEAYGEAVGWALGDAHGTGGPEEDEADADALYSLLENEVVPTFYARNEHGVPERWVTMVRESMATLTPRYSTNRMVRQYTEECYLPAAADVQRRLADGAALARGLERWIGRLSENWDQIHFGRILLAPDGDMYAVECQVYLGEVEAGDIHVEVYAEPRESGEQAVWPLQCDEALTGAAHGYVYRGAVPGGRPDRDYTPRVVPSHPDAHIPAETDRVLWAR